jgi:hypothetical protein
VTTFLPLAGPTGRPPADWSERMAWLVQENANLRSQLEVIRQQEGPHPAELVAACTCAVPEVNPQCPAHGLVADLVAYGRRWEAFERAMSATIGPDMDPWADPAELALNAVREVIAINAALLRTGIRYPQGLGGVDLLIVQWAEASRHASEWEDFAKGWKREAETAQVERNSYMKAAEESDAEVEGLAAQLDGLTQQLTLSTAEVRHLRADNAQLRAQQAMEESADAQQAG